MKDAFEKGRLTHFGDMNKACGSKNGSAKLNEDKVAEILSLLRDGRHTLGQIAKQFGVYKAQIWRIKTGELWSHVPRTSVMTAG